MNSVAMRFWLTMMFALSLPFAAQAQTVITLTTGERPPYIDATLPEGGYVAELVSEVFRRSGYRVKLQYSTWARARLQAGQDDVVGMISSNAVNLSIPASKEFVYSEHFFGGFTGLLKKNSTQFSPSSESLSQSNALVKALAPYRLGAVRDGVTSAAIEQASELKRELFINDVQNIDMLSQDRVQLALIDKYSAADLMVRQRPNLIGQLEFIPLPTAQTDFYLAFATRHKNHQQLLAAFNQGLEQVKRDGSFEKILNRHGLFLPAKTPSKLQLTIGTVNNNDMLVMQKLSKDFEKQFPQISLEWRVMDENTLRRRLLSDFAIGDGQFDVMTIGTYELPIWAKRGWLTPLQHLSKNYAVEDLLPGVRQHLSYNGQLYALPFYGESAMTYYRKDLFAKAGLTMPAQPSYDNLFALAAKLHHPEAGVYGICLRGKPGWGENMALISMLLHAHGGRWFDERWEPEIAAPSWQKAVAVYIELLRKYGPPNADKNGFNENLALFSNGQCGMWIDATVAAGMLFDPKRSKVASQLGFAPAPIQGNVDVKLGSWLWSWALAIPQSSPHKLEAEQFISWATSQAYIQQVAASEGWVAVPPGTRKSTYANPNYKSAAPFAQFVLHAIEEAESTDPKERKLAGRPYFPVQYVSIPEFQAIGDHTGLEIAKVLRREQSVETALKRAQNFAMLQMHSAPGK